MRIFILSFALLMVSACGQPDVISIDVELSEKTRKRKSSCSAKVDIANDLQDDIERLTFELVSGSRSNARLTIEDLAAGKVRSRNNIAFGKKCPATEDLKIRVTSCVADDDSCRELVRLRKTSAANSV